MANIGDNNSDFSSRNTTSNSRIMYFIIVSIIALMIIKYNIYIYMTYINNFGFR